jgi:hypothetical protein
MSDFSATDVAFTGIRFVREHPRAVAIWAAIQVILSLLLGVVAVVTLGPYMAQMQALNHPGPATDPAQVFGLLAHVAPMYVLFLMFGLLFYAVLYATMSRAVLEPAEERLSYIRFGMDEARQLLLVLLWIVITAVFYAVALAAAIAGALVLAGTPRAIHGLLVVIACLLVAAAAIYCLVRLSLATALTFDSRRVDLFGSWRLTRGRFWKMLGTYLLVLGVGLIIMILTTIITVAAAAVLGGIGAVASVFQSGMASMGSMNAFFVPARLAVSLIWALVTPLMWALFFMPAPAIYRQLRDS